MAHDRAIERPEVRQPEPPPGEWLYKLRGEIFGPVPAQEIIDRMYAGEVDESTEISLEEGDWVTVHAVPDFHPFLFQAKAKLRAERARAEAELAARRRRLRSRIKVGIGAFILVVVSFLASYVLIVSRPWRSDDTLLAWAGKHLPLLSVASAGTMGDGRAEAMDNIDIDQILIDDAPALVALKSARRRQRRPAKKKSTSPGTPTKPAKKQPNGKTGGETKVASAGPLSNDEIVSIVYGRSSMRRFYSCLRSELHRNPDMPATIVMEFTISNDGKAGKVRMDDPKLENSTLHKCFSKRVATLRFRTFTGQVRNVTIPFKINK
jgi:hypothetical protein